MRNLGLDLLRFTALFLVLGRHLELPEDPNQLLQSWHRGGWVGVDLFFVLSGFLVSSLMFREHQRTGAVDLKRFLIRRGFKIYPAFCTLLWSTVLMNVFVFRNPPSRKQLIGEMLFLQNYLGNVWGYTWSLAVEEHFYLGIAALFAFWMWRNPNRGFSAIPSLFLMISLTCCTFRIMNLFVYSTYTHDTHLFGTHLRMDSLFFGVLVAYLCAFHNLEQKLNRIPTWAFVGVGGLLLSPAFVFTLEEYRFIPTFGVMLFYVGSGALVLGALRFRESRFRPLRLLGLLGAASYSIYLWHGPVGRWGWDALSQVTGLQGFSAYCVTYLVGSCLVGFAMSRLIEVPALRARDFLFPSLISASVSGRAPAADSSSTPEDTPHVITPFDQEYRPAA